MCFGSWPARLRPGSGRLWLSFGARTRFSLGACEVRRMGARAGNWGLWEICRPAHLRRGMRRKETQFRRTGAPPSAGRIPPWCVRRTLSTIRSATAPTGSNGSICSSPCRPSGTNSRALIASRCAGFSGNLISSHTAFRLPSFATQLSDQRRQELAKVRQGIGYA